MEERVLGRTERPVSVIGLGTWQLGADWGEVGETEAGLWRRGELADGGRHGRFEPAAGRR